MFKTLNLTNAASLLSGLLFLSAATAPAQSTNPAASVKPAAVQPIREIYVPFEDLNVILDNDHNRVYLTRAEYDELIRAARSQPQRPAPQKIALVAAEYKGQLGDGRALITGHLTMDVLADGLIGLPLALRGVGIRSALLDGQPAPLARPQDAGPNHRGGGPLLLVQGQGQHQLQLELVAPLEVAAAQQTLKIMLPTSAATRLRLAASGNIEVKGGAAVVQRTFAEAANRTEFELAPQHGELTLVLSLNNRVLQQERVVSASSVIVAEVTQGYERIHGTISYRVLHGAVEQLRVAIPPGFDVLKADSLWLARWEEKLEAGRGKVLEVTLREPTSERIVLHVVASRTAGADWLTKLENWQFPRLDALETTGQVSVLGLLAEDRLKVEHVATENLLPVDSAALAAAIPASVLKAEAGSPVVRQVASYFAPAGEYAWSARWQRPPVGLKVVANSLLVIGEQNLKLQGGFALTPQAEELFNLRFSLPPGWQVTRMTDAAGAEIPLERYVSGETTTISARLPGGIRPGQTQTVNYEAVFVPPGWLAEWTSQTIEYPRVLIEGASSYTGAVAAQVFDDLAVRPESLSGLMPLLEHERSGLGLGNVPAAVAYQFEDANFALQLVSERTRPSITATVYSLLALARENLVAHYELAYDVRQARTRQVSFSLPIATPVELAIRGQGGAVVKEFSSRDEGQRRRWTVQLAERQLGPVRLTVDFTQRMPAASQQNAALPLIQAEDVEHQSGLVAVEGDAELDVTLTTDAREVDIGELAALARPLGRRVVGTFGYVGAGTAVRTTIKPREAYGLPPALIQRAELVTQVSASGRSQSIARYSLVTKATLLEIRLPPGGSLWTVLLDDEPTKPQREGQSLLLSLPAQQQVALRKLQLVYEAPVARLGLATTVETFAPRLLVRALGTDEEREIPQADLSWQLILPGGYSAVRAVGGVDSDEISPRVPAVMRAGWFLYELAGGIQPWYLYSARESARLGAIKTPFDGVQAIGAARSANSASPPLPAAATAEAIAPNSSVFRSEMTDLAAIAQNAPPEPQQQRQLALAFQQPSDKDAAAKKEQAKVWALEGVSTLKIDFEPGPRGATSFHSLGGDLPLAVVVVDQRRLDAASFGVALLVFLVGVGLTHRSSRDQALYLALVLACSLIPPLVTTALDQVGQVFDFVFFAGLALVPYYLVAGRLVAIWQWAASKIAVGGYAAPATPAVASLLVACLIAIGATGAQAQQPPAEDLTPVAVPADAIIVPYDLELSGDRSAEKLLVPYAKYVELWNLAHPEKRIESLEPGFGFAIAGAAYEATLTSGDSLALHGRLEIDVFADKPVAVPLNLSGGVLERATVNGQAARLQFAPRNAAATKAKAANTPPANSTNLLLLLSGKGRQSVELAIRLSIVRQGGWRVVRGQVPTGPAAALVLTAAEARTEIRQSSLPDRPSWQAQAANERLETALGSAGLLQLQWRPEVAEGMVDQALTARSLALFDVREDALRLTWQMKLEFGRGDRDAFSLAAPADYLLEQVAGDNVRTWTTQRQGHWQHIEVSLLKPVRGSQTLTLHLARRGRVGEGPLAEFEAPLVRAQDAALEQGELAIRKSPRLEVRTVEAQGLARIDHSAQTDPLVALADAADAAVLVVRPHQTFQFTRLPGRLVLSASPLPAEATAALRAALRVAERKTTLDAALVIKPQAQPVYDVRLYVPGGFSLTRLGPGDMESSLTATDDGRQLLSIHLLEGRTEEFTLTLLGDLAGPAAGDGPSRTLSLPQIELAGVTKQEGEIVVLPDPDTEVRLEGLQNCEGANLVSPPAWLKPEQQPLAKAAVRFRTAQYAGSAKLMPRQPLVSVRTISNVKITPRTIEETILLNFQIEQAGLARLSFLVPEALAQGRLRAQLLKEQKVEPATTAAGQPIPGLVRITLELQDDVRGQYAVLLERDRLLESGKQTVVLPVVETGRTDRRLVAVENAGRDEVLIDSRDVAGLEPLSPQQAAWRELASVLGQQVTQAYAALDSAAQPTLAFSTMRRPEAERAGARIGLATTLLVVDRSGTYRARVEYRVTNATEQFLELQLPAGAKLWTAQVDSAPVKPAAATPPRPQVARIPLVKTAAGEGDYLVELKYGGRLAPAGVFGSVEFPLIRDTNIHVELSQVRLYLPDSQSWFNFGGTLRLVQDEVELERGFQSYLGRRIQEAVQSLASGSDYTQVRAAMNLRQSRLLLEEKRRSGVASGYGLPALSAGNEALLEQAERQAPFQAGQQASLADNRERLSSYFEGQAVQRTKNVVSKLDSNFDGALPAEHRDEYSNFVNPDWVKQNQLQGGGAGVADAKGMAGMASGKPADAAAQPQARWFFRGAQPAESASAGAGAASAPQVAGKKELEELELKLSDRQDSERLKRSGAGQDLEQLQKYQHSLQQRLADQAAGGLAGGGFGFGGQGAPGGAPGISGGDSRSGQQAPTNGGGLGRGPGVRFGAADEAADAVLAAGEQLTQVAAGLASLNVQLPERGQRFFFTTPRGDIRITANSISRGALSRLYALGLVLLVVLVIWLLNRAAVRRVWLELLTSAVCGAALIVLGLASLVSGVLPLAGLLAIAAGIAIIVQARFVTPRGATAST